MTQHDHTEFHDWCYRCNLSRDEVDLFADDDEEPRWSVIVRERNGG